VLVDCIILPGVLLFTSISQLYMRPYSYTLPSFNHLYIIDWYFIWLLVFVECRLEVKSECELCIP